MGRHVPPGQEAAVLRALIAEARQATRELDAAIKEAKELEPGLVAEFERIHATEIKQLSNYLTEESNRHAASLNADVERARMMINETIMTGEAVFDRHTKTVAIKWGGGGFDAAQPPPYPEAAPKGPNQ